MKFSLVFALALAGSFVAALPAPEQVNSEVYAVEDGSAGVSTSEPVEVMPLTCLIAIISNLSDFFRDVLTPGTKITTSITTTVDITTNTTTMTNTRTRRHTGRVTSTAIRRGASTTNITIIITTVSTMIGTKARSIERVAIMGIIRTTTHI
jgi:hypothetical protein